MAHHKDAIKRIKQNEKRRTKNRHYRSRMRNQIKKVRAAVEAGDHAAAMDQLRTAQSVIARVVSKGVIHKNAAARRISRLNKAVKALA
ncbi:MAG: 30S ribosomal protein S20 [Deltaproteobacteria bacterium]|nr:MAG: 30S ribosomal protein S20 [Deltaproteobacteria bacterium]